MTIEPIDISKICKYENEIPFSDIENIADKVNEIIKYLEIMKK
jgi:hypothetical protein